MAHEGTNCALAAKFNLEALRPWFYQLCQERDSLIVSQVHLSLVHAKEDIR